MGLALPRRRLPCSRGDRPQETPPRITCLTAPLLTRGSTCSFDQPLPDSAIDPVNQVQRVGAKACNLHDLGYAARLKAAKVGTGFQVLEQFQ